MHGGQDIHQNLASESEVEFVLNLFPKIHFSYEWARSCQFLFSFLFCVLNATESKGKNLYFLFLCEVSHHSPLVYSKMNNSNFTDMNKMLYTYPLKFEMQVLVLSHAETFNTFIFYVYLFFYISKYFERLSNPCLFFSLSHPPPRTKYFFFFQISSILIFSPYILLNLHPMYLILIKICNVTVFTFIILLFVFYILMINV